MYLQLAENNTNMYEAINTNQGTLYVRPDLLSAAGLKPAGKAAKPAAGQLVKKAAPTIIKTGVKAVPGGAAAGVALDLLKIGVQKIKEKRNTKKAKAAEAAAAEAAAAEKTAAEAAAAAAAQQSAAAIETDKKRNMFLIGGGILGAGLLIYLLTRKK